MEPLINILTLWLSLTLSLPAPGDHPQVRYATPHRLAALRYGALAGSSQEPQIMGAYDGLSKTIFLRADWDSRSPLDVSVLVHELVHYMQDRASADFECAGAREAQAYAAQQRWLALFGTDLERAFGIDAMTLKMRTACWPH
jgi:hypothetical protein